MLTCVPNSKSPSFNLCIITEEDGTSINNEYKILRRNAKIYSVLLLLKSSRKNPRF